VNVEPGIDNVLWRERGGPDGDFLNAAVQSGGLKIKKNHPISNTKP
jgi:hypothetical protein